MFFTSRYDRIFRTIFVDDTDFHLLEALLSTCLDKDIKIIKILKTELSVSSSKERVKRLDLLVETNGEKINIELNTSFDDATKVRNFNYFTAFYSSNAKIGERYDYKTEFIHIDLSYHMGLNKPVFTDYYVCNKDGNDLYINNFKIIVINMDKIMKFWYDNDKKSIKKYDLIMMLDLQPNELNELKEISSNKDIIDEYKGKVCKLNEDLDFVAPISAEEDYIMLMNTQKQMAVEQGFAEGKEKGYIEGKEQGIEQERFQIIQNMQNANFTKEQILKCLDIDEDEYNRIIKEKK